MDIYVTEKEGKKNTESPLPNSQVLTTQSLGGPETCISLSASKHLSEVLAKCDHFHGFV